VQTQELFRLVTSGRGVAAAGAYRACGQVPAFYQQLRGAGEQPDLAAFRDAAADGGESCLPA
jgi:hypothetical protein